MANNDVLKRLSFNSGQIRGVAVQLHKGLTTLVGNHAYPPFIQALLGELSAATLMLKTLMDYQGRLHVHAKGDGQLQLLCLECDDQLHFRGLATLGEPLASQKLPDLLGNAQLAMTSIPDVGPTYQGIVPLTANQLSQCIEAYFVQSEQIPTRLWLTSNGQAAAGFLLQKLPSQQADDPDEWGRLTLLADTLTANEMLELPVDEWLDRLFHQEEIRIQKTLVPTFACRCSKERFLSNIKTLAKEDICQMLDEEGSIDVECEFCQTRYAFYPSDFD